VVEDGLTDIVADVPDDNVLSEESPVILYLKGAVPVKLIDRFVLLPLQILVVPLIVAFRTFKVAEADFAGEEPLFVAVNVFVAEAGVTVYVLPLAVPAVPVFVQLIVAGTSADIAKLSIHA
jgi:hypothetical protein